MGVLRHSGHPLLNDSPPGGGGVRQRSHLEAAFPLKVWDRGAARPARGSGGYPSTPRRAAVGSRGCSLRRTDGVRRRGSSGLDERRCRDRRNGSAALTEDAATFPLGRSAPDPLLDAVQECVLEALLLHGTGAADALCGFDAGAVGRKELTGFQIGRAHV